MLSSFWAGPPSLLKRCCLPRLPTPSPFFSSSLPFKYTLPLPPVPPAFPLARKTFAPLHALACLPAASSLLHFLICVALFQCLRVRPCFFRIFLVNDGLPLHAKAASCWPAALKCHDLPRFRLDFFPPGRSACFLSSCWRDFLSMARRPPPLFFSLCRHLALIEPPVEIKLFQAWRLGPHLTCLP